MDRLAIVSSLSFLIKSKRQLWVAWKVEEHSNMNNFLSVPEENFTLLNVGTIVGHRL